MLQEVLSRLRCAACGHEVISQAEFEKSSTGEVLEGVAWCPQCFFWYPIQEGVLEFLAGDLAYREDREIFWRQYQGKLESLGLKPFSPPDKKMSELQKQQQDHFDWYAANATQTYNDYAKTPFWVASDNIALDPWKSQMKPGKWLLEIGCAQGRSTFRFMDQELYIVGFDVSKKMIRLALERYRKEKPKAKAFFFVADAHHFPFKDEVFDYVLIYGVLHHLPKPESTCREVARVLKEGGIYFGQENNHTVFRFIFDWLQKVFPLWHEEAGPESMISKPMLENSFTGTGMSLKTSTSVFLPPHLVNLFSEKWAYWSLTATDRLGCSVPFLRDHGGVIIIQAHKNQKAFHEPLGTCS